MINNTNEFKTVMSRLLIDYYNLYPEASQINFEIILTDDLCKKHLELRPDLKDALLAEGIENENDYNGRTVCPKYVGDTISILVNSHKYKEYTDDKSYTWIGTIAHELTHAVDFSVMASKENLNTYDPLIKREKYLMFQLWTEYHARRVGYSFLRYELKVDTDNNSKEERINHIMKKEMPFHMNHFYNDYHSGIDGNKQLYLTMQMAGRFSVWCDLFPDIFNDIFLKDTFSQCLWLYNILVFLRNHESLDSVYDCFDEMRLILKDNWLFL